MAYILPAYITSMYSRFDLIPLNSLLQGEMTNVKHSWLIMSNWITNANTVVQKT